MTLRLLEGMNYSVLYPLKCLLLDKIIVLVERQVLVAASIQRCDHDKNRTTRTEVD